MSDSVEIVETSSRKILQLFSSKFFVIFTNVYFSFVVLSWSFASCGKFPTKDTAYSMTLVDYDSQFSREVDMKKIG